MNFFRIAAKPEQTYGEGNNSDGKPGEKGERERTYEDDVAIELLLLMKQRLLTEQRQWIAAVMGSARVGDRTGGSHDLLSPQRARRGYGTTRGCGRDENSLINIQLCSKVGKQEQWSERQYEFTLLLRY